MTVETNYNPIRQEGNGVTTSFSFAFEVASSSDIVVYQRIADIQSIVPSTDYTVQILSNGGNVIFNTAPAQGIIIVIDRDTPQTQETPYKTSSGFPAVRLEENLDKLTLMVQELQYDVNRSPKVDETSSVDPEELVEQVERVYQSIDNVDTVADNTTNVNTVATNIAKVNTVSGSIANVNTVGNSINSVNTVSADISKVNTVSGSIANVNTTAGSIINVNKVGNDIANVNAVAGDLTNIDNVADDLANIDAVANNATNINAVAGNESNINAVAGNATNINAVNANKTNIDAVAGNNANITAVANNATNINAVNANKTNIDTVATNIADVNSVAGDITKVTAVADDLTNIDAVNANKTNIDAVAGNNANITAVANNETNINAVNANKTNIDAVAGNATNINTVAGDITNINAVAADLTNIDNASAYAAEAKQWAIGDPTEPVDGSAKYWAGQAAAGQVQADWTEVDTTSKAYIRNKPTAGDNISFANNEISAVSDANPTLSSTKLVQSGGVYTGLNNLQTQIDAIVASSDVFDIVGTYAALQAYDITTVPVNDIIKVLVDETHSGAATYYRCVESGDVKSWSYIGAEGAYYTKGEADVLLAGRANTNLSNLSTTGQAVLDAKQDVATAVNYDNITNCITEIPQDIKLELNNGTLTLKAGSKVYVPNGFESDGTTPKFDVVTIENDINYSYSGTTTGESFIYLNIDTQGLTVSSTGGTKSEASITNAFVVYRTDLNEIHFYNTSGQQSDTRSLPIAIVQREPTITSIDQVFNGFGYIGSTVFALPGVKGLIPNGRNADGSLKNIEVTTTVVQRAQQGSSATSTNTIAIMNTNGTIGQGVNWYYNEKENLNYNTNNEKVTCLFWGTFDRTNGVVSNLNPKTSFHALDYNDFKQADDNNVKLTGDQTIAGTKTFSSSPILPTPATSDNSTKGATTAYVNNKFQVVTSLPASPDSNTFYFITA